MRKSENVADRVAEINEGQIRNDLPSQDKQLGFYSQCNRVKSFGRE